MNRPVLFQALSDTTSVSGAQKILKQLGTKHSFKTRADLEEFLLKLQWPYTMPWRSEQKSCLEAFCSPSWKELIIQAIFGGGKTTMMLAMIQHLALHGHPHGEGIQVLAFNVCIKNEIRKKLRFLGNKFRIQTFDSLIYQLCAELGYENLKALDFTGKRKFIQQNLAKITAVETIHYVFVDEAQDLEKVACDVLRKRFPNAKRVFVGDVFQSIQKEPRESMLWHLLRRPDHQEVIRFRMSETPRVPEPVLKEIRGALLRFYPEFSDTIRSWISSSALAAPLHKPIVWHSFETYKEVYEDLVRFIEEKGPENVMVLTFSSAITVRGVLGDVSRVRQFLMQRGIPVNTNHKNMKEGAVFLSTANSSKGLERDHVFGFLTFPLELAFANFSDDLVVNLMTVALSRCKKSVEMYVPRFNDRFSKVLTLYDACPKPLLKPCLKSGGKTNPKTLSDAVFEDKREDKRVMLEKEHAITEALRLSILSFSTKQELKSFVKRYRVQPLSQESVRGARLTEEDCTFSGLVFETLVLGTWKNSWPDNGAVSGLFQHHDMFASFQAKIKKMRNAFISFRNQHPHFATLPIAQQVNGACLYSALHLACFQKIFWRHNDALVEKIAGHWARIRGAIASFRPADAELGHLKVQHNLSMPFLNGIGDAILIPPKTSNALVEVFEIKASKSNDWQENALMQSILYGMALGRSLFRVHLVNVFHKEAQSFVVNFNQDFFRVRELVLSDIREWNLNCFLAKNATHHDQSKKTMNIRNTFFLDGHETPQAELTIEEGGAPPQFFLAEIVSPTKTFRHPIQDLAIDLPQLIQDFQIEKIVVGRNLSPGFLKTVCPDVSIFRHLRFSQPCFTKEATWQMYLESIGWFKHEFDAEHKKSFLTWSHPQCTFMVQWAHLCCLYNICN